MAHENRAVQVHAQPLQYCWHGRLVIDILWGDSMERGIPRVEPVLGIDQCHVFVSHGTVHNTDDANLADAGIVSVGGFHVNRPEADFTPGTTLVRFLTRFRRAGPRQPEPVREREPYEQWQDRQAGDAITIGRTAREQKRDRRVRLKWAKRWESIGQHEKAKTLRDTVAPQPDSPPTRNGHESPPL